MILLEHLPDEIWLEIFSYISCVDLCSCIFGLNERVNGILRSKLKLKLKTNLMYEKSKYVIELLPEYINRLSIEYHNQYIDISSLKNLLSLHLSHATNTQMILIQLNYFKHLKHLGIVVCSMAYQLEDILFGNNRLNHITTCWFPNLDSYFLDTKTYQPCFALSSLRLNYCNINTFLKLLPFLPNLINFESILVSLPLSSHLVSPPVIKHLTLNRLKIQLRPNVPLTDLELLLLPVPYLEQLDLNINRFHIHDATLESLEVYRLLKSRVQIMKQCNIKIHLRSSNIQINLNDLKKWSTTNSS